MNVEIKVTNTPNRYAKRTEYCEPEIIHKTIPISAMALPIIIDLYILFIHFFLNNRSKVF